MAGSGECNVGPLHPEGEDASAVRQRYAGSRKGIEWILPYRHELIQNPFRSPNSIVEHRKENASGLITGDCLSGDLPSL